MSGGDGGGSEPLKTAAAAVGLLAGVVAAVYVLGGLVIAMRLLFDHFSLQGAVTAVGQLPRETVIATALLSVLALAACVGLVAAMIYGFADRPRSRGEGPQPAEGETPEDFERRRCEAGINADRLTSGSWGRVISLFVFIALVAGAGALAGWHEANAADDGSPPVLPFLFAGLVTAGVLAAGWYEIRRISRRGWSRVEKALAAGAVWAGIAVVPALMLASTKPFEQAQLCTAGDPAPTKGKLIGESSRNVFLEEEFGREAAVVVLPIDQVTKREYGDLSSAFACPLPPGQKAALRVAEDKLDGHGGAQEVELATRLRPRLRFDSHERWRPLAVDSFLAERFGPGRGHLACSIGGGEGDGRPRDLCRGAPPLRRLQRGRGAPEYLEIEGSLGRPASYRAPESSGCVGAFVLDCNDGEDAVVYYRRTTHAGLWYWDYWWFFRFNDYSGEFNDCNAYCADHEGDWEGMTVVTTPSYPRPKLVGAIYAAHKDRVMVDAEFVPRRGGHPLVFVAAGTHASYPFGCAKGKCAQYGQLIGFRLPEEGHDGYAPWGPNVDAECEASRCVRPLPEVGSAPQRALPLAGEWAGWPGKWGGTCVRGCSAAEASPNSPGLQIRFRCPWVANRHARVAPNGLVSRSDPVGDAERLRAFCEAQRGGL